MKHAIVACLLMVILSAQAQLHILRVLPNKINYKLNEQALINVTVANAGNQTQQADLMLVDRWDLEQEKLIAAQPIQLAAGSQQTFSIPWNTGTVRYGHETRAIIRQNGTSVAEKSEFFNVINEWWRVNIGINPHVIGGTEQGDRLCKWYGFKPYNTPFSRFFHDCWGDSPIGPFASYFTNTTPWNMAFSTFGVYYDPSYKTTDTWYAEREKRTYEDFLKDTQLARKWGVHRTMFTIYCTTCEPGFELGRKHPEFFLKDSKGDFKYHDPVDPLGLSQKCQPYHGGWSYLSPDFTNSSVWSFAMDAVIQGLKHLGQDGLYFDGAYSCEDGYDFSGNFLRETYDFDQTNRDLSSYLNRRLRDYNPDIYFWVNNGGGGSYRNILSHPASGALWELANFHQDPRHALNIWSSLKECAVQERNVLWQTKFPQDIRSNILHIGYSNYPTGIWYVGPSKAAWAPNTEKYRNFKPSHQFWCINSHVAAIIAAVCGHPYGEGMAYRPFNQVMTRYSDFYWHEDIKLVKKAFRKFTVDSLREIWWEDFTYVRETADHTDYYIHLLNVPDVLRHSFKTLKETKPAKGVEITSRIFKDGAKLQAWAIQPYGVDTPTLEPMVTKLTHRLVNDERVLTLPPFRYYTLVVLREQKH